MLHLNKIILFLIIFNTVSYNQTIETIEFSGNKDFSLSDYLSWGNINRGNIYYEGIVDSVKVRIIKELSSRGYLHSSFTQSSYELSPDSQKAALNFNIDEGKQSRINSVIVDGVDSLHLEKIQLYFRYLQGEVFIQSEIERSISETLTYFENNGYPFVRVQISSVTLFEDSVSGLPLADILIKIISEQKSNIDIIEIKGNSSTKEYVILRETRITPGESYEQRKIEDIPSRLNRLRFFDPVRIPDYYFNSKNEGVLSIEVKERVTNNFDGIIGYIPPRTENEKGYITGLVNISMRNLFGTGRAAAIRWQQLDRFSQELELKYLEPYFFDYPFNINGRLHQRKQDTTYVQRLIEGSVEYLATEDITASVNFSTEVVIPTESLIPRFTVFNSTSLTTGLTFKYDTRDDVFAPTGGYLFLTSYSFSRKKINGPEQFLTDAIERNINLQRATVDFHLFYEFFQSQVAAVGLHWRELQGSFFEVSDLYRLGGTNTLRGYRENQFIGARIAWTNIEYRLLMARRSYVFLFFDAGYYLINEDEKRSIPKSEALKIGYGLGLNLETAIGVITVSFALAKGESFSEGKIHFGLVNEF